MPVYAVFENLEAGATIDEIAEWFDISKQEIVEVLRFTARSVAAPEPETAPEWLRESWASAKETGLDQLSPEEINAEVAAARQERNR